MIEVWIWATLMFGDTTPVNNTPEFTNEYGCNLALHNARIPEGFKVVCVTAKRERREDDKPEERGT